MNQRPDPTSPSSTVVTTRPPSPNTLGQDDPPASLPEGENNAGVGEGGPEGGGSDGGESR